MPCASRISIAGLVAVLLAHLVCADELQPVARQPAAPEPAVVMQTVLDATGQPLIGATVEVEFQPDRDDPAAPARGRFVTDDQGRIPLPNSNRGPRSGTATVSHGDFGSARGTIGGPDAERGEPFVVPLARRGSPAFERALKGTVAGPDGRPLAGARVHCSEVRSPGMTVAAAAASADALTDDRGRFALYLPRNPGRGGGGGGDLIPANSDFHLLVSHDGDASLFPHGGVFNSTREAAIRLQRPERRFDVRFEAPGGGFLAADRLAAVSVSYRRDERGQPMDLPRRYVVGGGHLPPGIYEARAYFGQATLEYRPLTLGAEHAEAALTFRLPPAVTFTGRIVDGTTGRPLAGAFVMAMTAVRHNNLGVLTAEQWATLRTADLGSAVDNEASRFIRENLYSFEAMIRADGQGRFTYVRPPGRDVYGLIAFDHQFLPARHRIGQIKAPAGNRADLGDLPLFPAGVLLVTPATTEQHLPVAHAFAFDHVAAAADRPAWLGPLLRLYDGNELSMERVHWLKINEANPLLVPAGVRLRVRLEAPYDERYAPAEVPGVLMLKQGEVVAARAPVAFARALEVTVRVVGPDGGPVEGAPVRRIHDGHDSWCVARNTDAQGRATVHVYPNSTGRVGVIDLDGHRGEGNLQVPFRVADKWDPRDAIEIRLTDRQLATLRTKPPR